MHRRASTAAAALAAAALTAFSAAPALATTGISRGPSTTTNPYVLPSTDGVSVKSILTADDAGSAANGYEFVGIPDGLGATRDGDRVSVQLNHELTPADGAVRAHGQKGSFVSTWSLDRRTLKAYTGADLIQPGVQFYNYVDQTYGGTPSPGGPNPRLLSDVFPAQSAVFARFCSATLTDPGQLLHRSGRKTRGYDGQIFFANEENGNEGRSFGVLSDGTAKQLPRLGLFSWENTVPARNDSDTTLVMGMEDATLAAQLWVYIGRKSNKGDAFRKAGLTNGSDWVIDAANAAVTNDAQFRAAYPKGTPANVELNAVDFDASGARQNVEAAADGLTLNRTEDGAWDPKRPNDFYFVTTAGSAEAGSSPARDGGGLWRLRFDDIENPEDGGTLTLLLDGTESPKLFNPDNLTVDGSGHVLIQEDPGGSDHIAKIYAYDIASDAVAEVATFDPAQFTPGAPQFITNDEESSGIIDTAAAFGRGTFLFDAQVHKRIGDPLVELGQLNLLKVDWQRVFPESHDD